MPSLTSDALTSDSGGLTFLADVIGTRPGERSDDEFRSAFDPASSLSRFQGAPDSFNGWHLTRILDEVA